MQQAALDRHAEFLSHFIKTAAVPPIYYLPVRFWFARMNVFEESSLPLELIPRKGSILPQRSCLKPRVLRLLRTV